MTELLEHDIFKIVLSLVAGAIIGAEREYKSKNAGFRTIIMVTVGSALFTIVSGELTGNHDFHVVGNIVVGIGFLGAGAIYKDAVSPKGLTTAATIWVSAAVGMAIGAGVYCLALWAVVIVMVVLLGFTYLQKFIDNFNNERLYKITALGNVDVLLPFERILKDCNLKGRSVVQSKRSGSVSFTFAIRGSEKGHLKLIDNLHRNPEIIEFETF